MTTPHFRFTREYARESQDFGRPTSAHTRSMDIPPDWIWFARTTFGLHAVLCRMEAEGDFRAALLEPLRGPIHRLEVPT